MSESRPASGASYAEVLDLVTSHDTALPPFDLLSRAQGFGTGLILGSFIVALAGLWVLR